ncbi:glycoside hydrolase family 61 protein F [Paraphoma chrysanthemicola]|nr:glycoside hydrolase family 61 protein F [Paraphoma chrysanthemicola]
MLSLPLFVAALLASTVMGHGHVKSVVMNSKTYTALLPAASPNFDAAPPSIMRKVYGKINAEAIYDVYHKNITCGGGAQPISDNGVARVGKVTAGSNVRYHWNDWPHISPILTYMARCDPDCGKFTGSEGKPWFKIEEYAVGPDGYWATERLTAQRNVWNVTIPACLAPGQYLIRHDIIQLTSAKDVGGAMFYPNCLQVEVTGTGKVVPTANLAGFPGAYSPTDPGILWNSYTQEDEDYVLPGPKLFTCPT